MLEYNPARTISRLSKIVEVRLAGFGLTHAQYRALSVLAEGELGASNVAEELDLRPSSVTFVMDALVARSLVARQVNDLDRRKVDHFLTARGRALLNKIDAALKRDLDHLLSLVDKRSAQGAWKSIETWDLALDRDRTA